VRRPGLAAATGILVLEWVGKLQEHIVLSWVAEHLAEQPLVAAALKWAMDYPFELAIVLVFVYILVVVLKARQISRGALLDNVDQHSQGFNSPSGDNSPVLINSTHNIVAGRDVHVHQPPSTHGRQPRVAFVSYGPIPATHLPSVQVGQTGFYLANDGEAAYEVLIEPFEVEPMVWARSKEIPRIEEKGSDYGLVWLAGHSPFAFDVGKWDLLGAMAKASGERNGHAMYRSDYSVEVSAIYRDADNHCWYRTTARLKYIASQGRLEFEAPTFETCGPTKPTPIPIPVLIPSIPPKLIPILSDEGPGNVKPAAPNFKVMYFLGIKNVQSAANVTANNVRAKLSYSHADGVDKFTVDPATWLTMFPEMLASFDSKVELAAAVMERLVFAGTTQENETCAVETEGKAMTLVYCGKPLKYGHWRLDGLIEADNCNAIAVSYEFGIAEDGTLFNLRSAIAVA